MENASKAVIIAGAIIIALAIVTFGIAIYSSVRESLVTAGVQIDNIVAQQYNQQYLVYDKEYVTGMEIKQCISEVLYNNANTSNPKIFSTGVTVDGKAYISISVTSGKKTAKNNLNSYPLSNIDNSKKYTSQIIIGNDGLVEKIIFKKK